MKKWQMQEAKAKLSKVIQKAINDGPQEISIRGKPAAIILSIKQYANLTSPKSSFVNFLRNSPLVGLELGLVRDDSPCREIEL
jgi:prevent-host-death family protein